MEIGSLQWYSGKTYKKILMWTILNIYAAILLGILFILMYFVINTLLYNMNYRRMNFNENMNRKMINLILHGVIALIMVSVAIYLSYFK